MPDTIDHSFDHSIDHPIDHPIDYHINHTLFSISPIDGRYYDKVKELADYASEAALNRYRLKVEIRWLIHLAKQTDIIELNEFSTEAHDYLEGLIKHYNLASAKQIKAIERETNHDVKAIEYYLKHHMANNAELTNYQEFVHFACTSEDINNLAYALMLKDMRDNLILPQLDRVHDFIKDYAKRYADLSMLARTHGQPASPTTLGKEFANVAMRLQRQITHLIQSPILGKLNGATGNFNAHHIAYPDVDWPKMTQVFIEQLGLTVNAYTTQIEPHDYIAELMHVLQRINTILIDFARDIWGYIAMDYFTQSKLENEVGSSTMPHKINPIDFENAEGNLGIANALSQFFAEKLPISRWQRDLTDSTVLRNIGTAFAHSLLAYKALLKGLNKLKVNTAVITQDLTAHSEVLAEAIQTVMRRYGIANPYEKLKALTRGEKITQQKLQQFISTLDLTEQVKQQLSQLHATDYIGLAEKLANKVS